MESTTYAGARVGDDRQVNHNSRQLGYSLTQIRSQSFGIRYYPMLPICIVYHELRMHANNNQCFNAINRHHPRTDLP